MENSFVILLNSSLFGRSAAIDFVLFVFAEISPIVVVLAVPFLALRRRGLKDQFLFAASAFGAALISRFVITEFIRLVIDRPRPFEALDMVQTFSHAPGHSFPSGHASFVFTLAFFAWFSDKRIGAALFLIAVLMGIARVVAGFHYPSDIAGGMAIALPVAFFAHRFYTKASK